MVRLDEPLPVVASFGAAGNLKPLRFRWSDRVIQVRKVTYRWVKRDGGRKYYLFSVTDGRTIYDLLFDPSTLCWRLMGVEADI